MRWTAVLSLWAVTFDAGFGQQPPDRKQPVVLAEKINVPVSAGTFTFSQITWLPREKGSDTPRITGRVTNKTGKRSASTTFEIQLLGDKGQPLLRSAWEKASYSLDDGQTVPLFEKAPEGYGLAGLRKADQNRVSGVEIRWKKSYEFRLIKPILSEELLYREDGLTFAFTPGQSGIALTLANGTEKPVTIDWNQVTYIGIGASSSKVVHEGVRFIQADSPMPPTVVPPSARVTDVVIPTFALNMKFGVWTVEDILPSGQDAVKLLGQNIGLFLPLDIDGKVKNFLFTFKITQTGD
jgi:hypothetical protein